MLKRYALLLSSLVLASLSVLILKSIAPGLLAQQALFFLVGFVAFFFTSKFKFKDFQHLSPAFYLLLVLLLIIALFNKAIKGSARWIVLPGGFHLQPSQLAITFTGLLLTQLVQDVKKKLSWKKLLHVLGLILLPAFLIYIEPDFGSTMIFLVATGSILYFLPLNRFQYLSLFITAALALSIIFAFLLKPHQKQRLLSFSGGEAQENYNAQQALIAVGSGRIFGRGLGLGIQSHMRFLPERQTDFIFASIAEEVGFLGSSALLISYFFLCLYIIYTAEKSKSMGAQLFCYISVIALIIQILINIGMNSKMLPITGVTLPLVSYGGSSVIATLFSLGIIQSIALEEKNKSAQQIR